MPKLITAASADAPPSGNRIASPRASAIRSAERTRADLLEPEPQHLVREVDADHTAGARRRGKRDIGRAGAQVEHGIGGLQIAAP